MQKTPIAKTPKEFIAAIADPARRATIVQLDAFIRKNAPTLKPHVHQQYGNLAYGPYPYKGASGAIGEWFRIGIANRKNYISLSICALIDGKYIAEAHKKELGKVKVGKSCIDIKKIEDVNMAELKVVIKEAISKKSVGVGEC